MSDEHQEDPLLDQPALTRADSPAVSPRFAGYLCPPAGIWLHWKTVQSGIMEKIVSTIGLLIISILHLIVGVWLLKAIGLVVVDWPGYGFPPGLAWASPSLSASDWEKSTATIDTNSTDIWPGFRGAQRDGVYTNSAIRTDWDKAPPRLLWRTKIGKGHSSMTIAQGLVFTQEQRIEGEVVTAYNAADGKGVWQHVQGGKFVDSYGMGGVGPRSTPTWDDGKLYVLGAAGLLTCHDATTGMLIWEKNLLEEYETRNLGFGMCAAPLVVGNQLIITTGGKGRGTKTVVALDKATGKEVWAAAHGTQAYMSPMLMTLAGTEQLVVIGSREVQGLSPDDGNQLWSHRWSVSYGNNIAQPIAVSSDRLFISAGYGKGSALLHVSGNSTDASVKQIHDTKSLKNKFTSSVLYEGHIFGLDDQDDKRAALVCLDANTLEEKWRGDDYGHGQLLLASGHLVILSEAGEIALVKATPSSFQQVARIPAISGKTWNHPAISGGRLYIRNSSVMACYDISEGSEGGSAGLGFSTTQTVQVMLAGLGLMLLLGGGVLLAISFGRRPTAVPENPEPA